MFSSMWEKLFEEYQWQLATKNASAVLYKYLRSIFFNYYTTKGFKYIWNFLNAVIIIYNSMYKINRSNLSWHVYLYVFLL